MLSKAKVLDLIAKCCLYILYYLANLFILSALNDIWNTKLSLRQYILPIFILFIISFVTQFAYKVSDSLYTFIYYIAGVFFGMDIHFLWIISLHKFLKMFINFPKKISIFICTIFPILISLYSMRQAGMIYITNINLKVKKKLKNKIKICHLSDLHLGVIYQTVFSESIVNIIKKDINPDVIVITGDLFDSNSIPNFNWMIPFKNISTEYPILFVTGNHEYLIGKRVVQDIIKRCGIKWIGDSPECTTIKEEFDFFGINYEYDFIKKIKDFDIDSKKINILLGHYPLLNPNEIGALKFDLFLAGHTHGGQMFPIHLMDSLGYKCFSGLYEKNGKWVYVSPGLGTVIFPMRLMADSSIGVITIESE